MQDLCETQAPRSGPGTVVVLAGEGGHAAQAQRFCAGLEKRGQSVTLFTERESWLLPSISRLSKEGKFAHWISIVAVIFWFPACLIYSLTSSRFRRASLVVSFGPMTTVPLALASQMVGKRLIYIESWSRFETISLTCRLHRRLGASFLVQNPMHLGKDKPDCMGRLG